MSIFMELAISHARNVGLETLPNPKVGAVIVKHKKIIATGSTQAYGGLHAEAVALLQAEKRAKGASLYCTLEPCCGNWQGKHQTPCVEKIVEAGIKEVYIACLDSNPKVHGKGVEYLRNNGIVVHVLETTEEYKKAHTTNTSIITALRELNEVFEHLQHFPSRPFVHIKIAQTLDAKMTGKDNTQVAITGLESKKLVHAMRANHQALLTGIDTITIDNPFFTVRDSEGKNPALVIMDSELKIQTAAHVLEVAERRRFGKNQSSIFIFTSKQGYNNTSKVKQLESQGIVVVVVNSYKWEGSTQLVLEEVLEYLYTCNIYSILVETGPRLASNFLQSGLTSKLTCIMSSQFLGMGKGIGDYFADASSKVAKKPEPITPSFSTRLHRLQSSVSSDGKDIIISGYTYDMY